MKKIKNDNLNTQFYFIGAGGVSMSGLIKHLHLSGQNVSGSEIGALDQVQELKKLGIKIYDKHLPKQVKTAQTVVYTSAVSDDNPELTYAKTHGKQVIKRSELLGKILSEHKTSIGISGCHGKTTATAMLAHVLISANKQPTVFLGGNDIDFGNYLSGSKEIAVAEACEYKRNFLDLKPNIAVVLNVDNDHLDTYKTEQNLCDTFSEFISQSISVINADDRLSKKLFNSTTVTFGIDNTATYTAKNVSQTSNGCSFTACAYGRVLGRIKLNVCGRHNVYNALSAIAVGDILRIDFKHIKNGLQNFKGVQRRNEYLGKNFGVNFYADYAHHPREITATVKTFCTQHENFITVFQPHTFSRTRLLMQDFISALKTLSPLIIYKTYPAREDYDELGSAETLYKNLVLQGTNCYYASTMKEVINILKKHKQENKTALFLGAGDIYQIAKDILVQN